MPHRLPERFRPWHGAVLVAVAALLVYAAHLGNAFVSLDDGLLITKNPATQEISLRSLRYIFTSYDPELYVPLTLFSYQLNEFVFGLHPFWYHLVNLLLHIVNAVMVMMVANVLMKANRENRANRASVIAFLVALLFAVHPLHTEAVLWASARKDVLSGFFFLASLQLYLRWAEEGSRRSYRWSVAAFGLGLLSKVSIITLPLMLVLVDWYRGRRLDRAALLEKLPYLALALVFGVIAVVGKTKVIESSGFTLNLLLASKSAMFYLWKAVAPFGFTAVYPQAQPVSPLQPDIALSLIGVALFALLTLFAFFKRRSPLTALALGWYALLLLPNSTNFLKNGFLFFASDRYAYLASVGIFLLAAHLLRRWKPALILLAAAVPVLAVLSYRQGFAWKDSQALYRTVLALYPQSALAHNNLGDILMKAGRAEEAEEHFRKALSIDPGMMSAHLNMGNVYRDRGDFAKAEAEYTLSIKAVDAKPVLNLDELGPYYYLAQLYDQMGRIEDALAQFRRAVERAPLYAEPHYNLGVTLRKHGRNADAQRELETAVRLDDFQVDAHYHLASIYAESGRLEDAIRELEAVLRLQPGYPKAAEHLEAMRKMR